MKPALVFEVVKNKTWTENSFLSFPVLLNVCRGFQQLSGVGGGCISGSSIVVERNTTTTIVFLLKTMLTQSSCDEF